MAPVALIARISAPAISIKHPETFQIAAALPLPQPSSLIGALAYCLGAYTGIGLTALDRVKSLVLAARARLLSEIEVITPIILRRFRILDKGFEKKGFLKALEKLRSHDFEGFRNIIEGELTDALYREYLSQTTFKCVWIVEGELDSRIAYLLQRLGDTESLVTVEEAWSAECSLEYADHVETEYPFTVPREEIENMRGEYTIIRMCDEKRERQMFYVPCRKSIRRTKSGVKYFVYQPTRMVAKFKERLRIYRIENETIVVG